jgi:hypothetical protein
MTSNKILSIPAILVMTLLVSELGLADERPRNVTLVIDRTEVRRHADGRTDTYKLSVGIYYASDGTAYVRFDPKNGNNVGVVVPPNVSSGSYNYDEDRGPPLGPMRITITASIYGQMSNLNIMMTTNLCDVAGRWRSCAHHMQGFILQVSGTTCAVVGGTTNVKSDSAATNPTVSASIVGPQTCSIRPGRQYPEVK